MDKVEETFQAWFLQHYEWYIRMKRRGYRLDKDDKGDYAWEPAKQDWIVWQAAIKLMNSGENK